ncbi:hypothetical protein DASC09_062370 [Saccharomycopsis crataegensis]|uniref:PHD-type domain-containing protein n=1 Tax=Saccharomycopsis crataegensis TaxID=43959 RepID=A0AAV5QVD4_9ASCO|nr:hypothetical protein DASC09_062370 [Saccharomycopsis crataegensis]
MFSTHIAVAELDLNMDGFSNGASHNNTFEEIGNDVLNFDEILEPGSFENKEDSSSVDNVLPKENSIGTDALNGDDATRNDKNNLFQSLSTPSIISSTASFHAIDGNISDDTFGTNNKSSSVPLSDIYSNESSASSSQISPTSKSQTPVRRSKRVSEAARQTSTEEELQRKLFENEISKKFQVTVEGKKKIYISTNDSFHDQQSVPEKKNKSKVNHSKKGTKNKKQGDSSVDVDDLDERIQAQTKAIVTGYPLEFAPPAKVQKEALWKKTKIGSGPGRKGNKGGRRIHKGSNNDGSKDPTPELTKETLENQIDRMAPERQLEKKLQLDKGLKTPEADELTSQSFIRDAQNVKPVVKRGSLKYEVVRVPTSKKRKTASLIEPSDNFNSSSKKKKIKKITLNTTPKLTNGSFGYGGPIDLTDTPRANSGSLQPLDNNEEFCSGCGEPGSFLCCEGCPKSFHFSCLDPPLDEEELPDGDWFCDHCVAKNHKDKLKAPPGIFGKLLLSLQKTNPHRFELPRKIRERYEGVSTGKLGEYQDDDTKASKEVQKGVLQQLEPIKAFDKDGKPMFCYKCGESGIGGKELTKCEYCPLFWHLDCLSPPLASVKLLGTKWKCPNHNDGLYKKKRRLKKASVLDVSVTRGFKSKNNDIDIQNTEETEKYFGDTSLLDTSDQTILEQNDASNVFKDKRFEDRMPEFFKIKDEAEGLSAAIPKENLKNFAKGKNRDDIEIIYRVPERGLLLDFVSKVREKRETEIKEFNNATLGCLNEILKMKVDYSQEVLKNFNGAKNLLELQNSLVTYNKTQEFNAFVNNILNHSNIEGNNVGIDNEEEKMELLNLKRMMMLVDREKLKEFLSCELSGKQGKD